MTDDSVQYDDHYGDIHESGHGGIDHQVAFVFLFTAILVGVVVSYAISRYSPDLPYTVVLFTTGLAFALAKKYDDGENIFRWTFEQWDSMDPHFLLYAFLPALLFGEAMSLNYHHIKAALYPSLILAGPGSLIGTIGVAVVARFILPYEWKWPLCLVFGSILCATDPVAVVALLKKLGASSKLTYNIVGEALLNDGVALVLFNLFYLLIEKDPVTLTPWMVTEYLLRVIFISPLLGLAFGGGALFLMKLANRSAKEEDTIMQVSATLACAYSSFFIGEYVVEVSGVLTCCTAGVVLAIFAPPIILHHETLHSIWGTIEWLGNTLLFLVAGLIIGGRSIEYVHSFHDLIYIPVIYAMMVVVRGIMMAMLFPILNFKFTEQQKLEPLRITAAEAAFSTWGGLRGAVSMALALVLEHGVAAGETTIAIQDAYRLFYLVGGAAALTLIVNAVTARTSLMWLNLLDSSVSLETQIMNDYARKRILARSLQCLEEVKAEDPKDFNRNLILRYCSILRKLDDDEMLKKCEAEFTKDDHVAASEQVTAPKSSKAAAAVDENTTSPISLEMKHQRALRHTRDSFYQAGDPYAELEKDIEERMASSLAVKRQDQRKEKALAAEANDDPPPARTTSSTADNNQQEYDGGNDGGVVYSTRIPFASKPAAASPNPPLSGSPNRPRLGSNDSQVSNRSNENKLLPKFMQSADSDNDLYGSIKVGRILSGSEKDPGGGGGGGIRVARGLTSLGMLSLGSSTKAGGKFQTSESGRIQLPNRGISYGQSMFNLVAKPIIKQKDVRQELITQMHRAFLEVVRVNYWKQIKTGRLPRNSGAARILLHSVDVAMEEIDTPGLNDWTVIKNEFIQLSDEMDDEAEPELRGLTRKLSSIMMPSQASPTSMEKKEKSKLNKAPTAKQQAKIDAANAKPSLQKSFSTVLNHDYQERIAESDGMGYYTLTPGNNLSDSSSSPPPINQHKTKRMQRISSTLAQDDVEQESVSVKHMEQKASYFWEGGLLQRFNNFWGPIIRQVKQSQLIYVVTSFIEAHEYAQKKMPLYLGDTSHLDSPEQEKVVEESKEIIAAAKKFLEQLDPGMKILQISKKSARWILHTQHDMIVEFLHEGMITESTAEIFFEEVEGDMKLLRNEEGWSMFIAKAQGWVAKSIQDKINHVTGMFGRHEDYSSDASDGHDDRDDEWSDHGGELESHSHMSRRLSLGSEGQHSSMSQAIERRMSITSTGGDGEATLHIGGHGHHHHHEDQTRCCTGAWINNWEYTEGYTYGIAPMEPPTPAAHPSRRSFSLQLKEEEQEGELNTPASTPLSGPSRMAAFIKSKSRRSFTKEDSSFSSSTPKPDAAVKDTSPNNNNNNGAPKTLEVAAASTDGAKPASRMSLSLPKRSMLMGHSEEEESSVVAVDTVKVDTAVTASSSAAAKSDALGDGDISAVNDNN